ncbi:MAG: GyrI-like domain-containing protein [Microbacterium sp.]
MSDKVDFTKTLDAYRAKRGEFRVLDVPPLQYLMVDGHGNPNSPPAYAEALATLYPVAYTLKFASKKDGRDYVVPPLEGLWWADDMDSFTSARDKSQWHWTMMLLVPEWLGATEVEAAMAKVAAKDAPAGLDDLRLSILQEGLCVQTLHLGSFDDEAHVLERMHREVIPTHGLRMTGRHHEVYFTDPRRTTPERQRTLLRPPVARVP